MEIKPYKQSLSNSCLVAAFLMLLESEHKIEFSKKEEEEIVMKGMNRKFSFYIVGVPKEFFYKYKKRINIVVDNKYFTNVLIKEFKDKKNFKIVHEKITIDLIKKLILKQPVICHIDDNLLGDYSHASHFIVIEKATDKNFMIIDPWSGKRKLISSNKLISSFFSSGFDKLEIIIFGKT